MMRIKSFINDESEVLTYQYKLHFEYYNDFIHFYGDYKDSDECNKSCWSRFRGILRRFAEKN